MILILILKDTRQKPLSGITSRREVGEDLAALDPKPGFKHFQAWAVLGLEWEAVPVFDGTRRVEAMLVALAFECETVEPAFGAGG